MNSFDCPSSCLFQQARNPDLDFPIGQLRRLSASGASPTDVDETKRNLIKLLAVAGAIGAAGGGLTVGALQYVQPPTVGIGSYPKVQLLDLDGSNLTIAKAESEYNSYTSQVFTFYYPLRNEPNFFLNLAPPPGGIGATDVKGGIGTQNSIVAFSAICQHLGCPAPAIAYYPPKTCPQTPGGKLFYIHCSCHGSTYDVTNGASNLTGPAVLPLPQVTLTTDAAGNIYANGMNGPPVNGHLNTLTGDYGVGNTSQIQKQAPIISCNIL
jgi:Rieske Fe-S protein